MASPFPKLQNDLILRVIKGEKVERTPVWIMRQAGRYLPEFRELRKKHSFFELVRSPELCCQITIQPIDRYGLDAAIIFSDILIICQAVGMEVRMEEGKGPVFPKPLESPSDLENLNFNVNVEESMGYLLEAISLTRKKLDGRCPLIGFCGAPWTLMCYMIDSKNSGNSRLFSGARKWLYKFPKESLILLEKIAHVVADLLLAQAKHGAQILMMFESHAEVLDHHLFTRFEMPFITRIARIVKQSLVSAPLMYFIKGGYYIIDDLIEKTPFDVIGLDWTIDPSLIKQTNKTLMGNMDPAALYADEEILRKMVSKTLKSFKHHRHIFNLGHGIYPDVDPKAVEILVDQIRNHVSENHD